MKQFLTTIMALLLFWQANAQNTRIKDNNSISWLNQFATIKFSSKWSAHLEYQWRRADGLQNWQQSLLRLGANYQVNPKLQLRLGYGWIETFAYGDFPLQAAGKRFPEHRMFQAATLNDVNGRFDMSHRFMIEQRWLGRYTSPSLPKPDDFVFLNRLRYMYRLQTPIGKKKMADKTAYAAIYDEVFLGFGKNVNENVFDQNRLGILLGYRFNSKLRVEGGFLQQILQLGREINTRDVFQYNNGLIINANYNLNWERK